VNVADTGAIAAAGARAAAFRAPLASWRRHEAAEFPLEELRKANCRPILE
jgi:hypothetical protein